MHQAARPSLWTRVKSYLLTYLSESLPSTTTCRVFADQILVAVSRLTYLLTRLTADHVPGAPGRMRSACTWRLPELPVYAQGVQEGHPLLGGSIARPSEQPLTCGDLWRHRAHTRVHQSAQMARARRLEVRGDPATAMRGCSNFAARPAGVKLRDKLPSHGSWPTACPASGSR